MADIAIGKDAKTLETSDKLQGFSQVIIRTGKTDNEGNEYIYSAGSTTGRTLEIDNPWGNQTVANNILAKIQGWAYQPMSASSVDLPPAFEIGDSVIVNGVYTGVYNAKVRFSHVFAGDIEAPFDKEIDHEYQYEDSKERKYNRKIDDAVARLNFYADSIEAKVDKVNNGSTFGWRLTDNGWTVFNETGNLFSVNANGASVTGEIKANTGKIGNFNIGANGLWNGQSQFNGQEQYGVYIGTDGIQLGTKFRVDNQGNLYAENGYFNGNVYASNILYGTGGSGQNYGYLNGAAISGTSLNASQFVQTVQNSLGYADLFNSATIQGSGRYPTYFCADTVSANTGMLSPEYYVYDAQTNAAGSLKGHTHLVTVSGNTVTIGAPDFSGTAHSFNIAGTATVQSITLVSATYESSRRRYAVSVKATLSNGNSSTNTIYVNASDAYTAGFNACDISWSDGDYDIWIHPYYYDSWEEICGGMLHAKLTNGRERTRRLNTWDA